MAAPALFCSPPAATDVVRRLDLPLRRCELRCALGQEVHNSPRSAGSGCGSRLRFVGVRPQCVVSEVCDQVTATLAVDPSTVVFRQAVAEDELWATIQLRVRTFYEFRDSVGVENYKRSLMEREFEALKDRVSGRSVGYTRVACINATIPLSGALANAHDLCSSCKFSENGEERVVIGTLDLNQCYSLGDELIGKRPEGIGADLTRAYLSNVCVAEETQRNGLGYKLIKKSQKTAKSWGITDLYVHVAVDNEAAKILYQKGGFTYENEEQAWQARFLGRPKRFLLWTGL